MKPLASMLPLMLTASVLLAQQPPATASAPKESEDPAHRAAPPKSALQPAAALSQASLEEEPQLDNPPDQDIDPPDTTPPPAADIDQQRRASASLQKSIPQGALSLAASIGKNILVLRVNGRNVRTFPVSVGMRNYQTPQGHFGIRHIVWNPTWHPPRKGWAKGKTAKGPASPDNPMKIVKIFFKKPDYYIHGTDHEDKLGKAASHGCIRMGLSDVYELARLLQERGGRERQPQWYARVVNGGQSASVVLPKAVPIVIGW